MRTDPDSEITVNSLIPGALYEAFTCIWALRAGKPL
jgi:hypothetical protein